jgi:hypothetical protein
MTNADLGLILIGLSLTGHIIGRPRRWPWAPSVGVFTGILLYGITGLLGGWIAAIERKALALAGSLGAHVLGVTVTAVSGLIAAVLIALMLHGWSGGRARHTFWVSALVAVLFATAATPWIALNNLPATVQTSVSGG